MENVRWPEKLEEMGEKSSGGQEKRRKFTRKLN